MADKLLQSLMPTLNARLDSFQQQMTDLKNDMDRKFDRVEARFERFEERFERLDERFERFDGKFEAMEGRFDAKFDAMEGRLDGKFEAMERKFDIKFEAMEGKLKNLDDKVNVRFERQTELINELGIRMNGVATKFETTSTFPRLLSVTSISFLNAS